MSGGGRPVRPGQNNNAHQINGQIRDREVRLIGEEGEQLGIMSSLDAQRIADAEGKDLVKISPQAVPPVCKIMDYGKFKYESTKKEKENKANQKIVKLKEIWLSATIDTHDMMTKAKHCNDFLGDGDRVRVSIRLKGRQQARPEIAMKVMAEFFEACKENGSMEKEALQEGRSIAMILAPSKAKLKPVKKEETENTETK